MNRTDAEYREQWAIIAAAARLLESVELEAIAATIERADSLGPILDPTAYRAGMHNLPPQREIVEKATAFRNSYRKQMERHRPQNSEPLGAIRTASSS